MTGLYRIGGRNIRIDSLGEGIHRCCEAYCAEDGAEDFTVRITPEDIADERERLLRDTPQGEQPVPDWSSFYLEYVAVHRKIAERMPDFDTLLMHGSAVAADGEGYLFTAVSGTGKSTHTRLWRELLGDRAVMVNDDKPLIRIAEDGAFVYGTPWSGKEGLNSNICVPLRAICLLERAEENWIRAVSAREVYPTLILQIYRPETAAGLSRTLTLIDRLCRAVRFYRLGCNMDLSAAELSYTTMKEGTDHEAETDVRHP